MTGTVRYVVHSVQRWLGRQRIEVLANDAIIDSVPPDDVEPLARYLYAMCWNRPGGDWSEFSLAAIMWLVYGTLDPAAFPLGSTPLDREGRSCLPVPYRDRPAAEVQP